MNYGWRSNPYLLWRIWDSGRYWFAIKGAVYYPVDTSVIGLGVNAMNVYKNKKEVEFSDAIAKPNQPLSFQPL